MFVSHVGEIYSAGFLPLSCGRFPGVSVVNTYQNHPTFLALRDPDPIPRGVRPVRVPRGVRREPGPGLRGVGRSAQHEPTASTSPAGNRSWFCLPIHEIAGAKTPGSGGARRERFNFRCHHGGTENFWKPGPLLSCGEQVDLHPWLGNDNILPAPFGQLLTPARQAISVPVNQNDFCIAVNLG